jgi:hypothetical protein
MPGSAGKDDRNRACSAAMNRLDKDDRLKLMKFVCSFAWADLDVNEKERQMVKKLMKSLHLGTEEQKQVEHWLAVPPAADEVDPASVPKAHRELFLSTIRQLIGSDGDISPDEAENYALFEALMR